MNPDPNRRGPSEPSRSSPNILGAATRREFIALVGAATLLAGCANRRVAAGSAGPAAPTTRSITNQFGTFDIPLEPRRLVVLDGRTGLETALALKMVPIAVDKNAFQEDGKVGRWLEWDPPAGMKTFAAGSGVSIEELASLAPDVMVGRGRNMKDLAEKLAAIAPIVPVDTEVPWQEELRKVGAWFGRDKLAEDAIAGYERELEEVRRRHAARIQGRVVASSP